MRRIRISMLLFLIPLLILPVQAADAEPIRCFSAADFCSREQELLGICITDFSGEGCALRCGSRAILPGDVLTAAQLDAMTAAGGEYSTDAALSYLPVFSGSVGAEEVLTVSLRGARNQPPETVSTDVQTYKNLAVTESFRCSDPDGDAVTYRIVRQPRRGTVTVHEDGTFTYTPKYERVGRDHFTYVAADSEGAESPETRIGIQIDKAISSGVFADMTGDPNEREALFLRSKGLLSGEYVAQTLCFRPEQTVSSEECLMMTMKLTGLEPAETETAGWFAPWQETALRAGLPVLNRENFTAQAAAAWIGGFTEDGAAAAWSSTEAAHPLTRREAAILLYELHRSCEETGCTYPWN